jgi:TetR/AcrR family tetracycline transcriptional repressor
VTRSRRATPVTRAELLDTALGIVDSDGLDALTMRRLADALGVEAMSLYHHVPNKESLLDWLVERMRSEMKIGPPSPDWRDTMAGILVEYRRVLSAHPNMLPLATRRTDHVSTSGLRFLIESGLTPESAVELYQSLIAFAVGFSTVGSSSGAADWAGAPDELVDRSRDWRAETFSRGLRILMDGYWAGEPTATRPRS